ncbi:hypothetical protein [Nocardioides luteus]|uniref:Secreted protein n=1 Tax=Nocardioides luteus TaxID=1844 RepID=A0A1J4N9W9_9ACTN|nr:hypothetical protein [Nocardioides luteus]OIJ28306.1 hypothetical protein UG56_002495 [Nocardioides luteus]
MNFVRRALAALGAVVALGGGLVAISSSPASAYDATPCLAPYWHSGVARYVQTCPDWGMSGTNDIPVYDLDASPPAIVGWIDAAGNDWYVCQKQVTQYDPYAYAGYYNDWFAYTLADNGKWGWAPEVFFQGGDNMEPDRKLALC